MCNCNISLGCTHCAYALQTTVRTSSVLHTLTAQLAGCFLQGEAHVYLTSQKTTRARCNSSTVRPSAPHTKTSTQYFCVLQICCRVRTRPHCVAYNSYATHKHSATCSAVTVCYRPHGRICDVRILRASLRDKLASRCAKFMDFCPTHVLCTTL